MKTCAVDGCENPLLARGLCNTHYIREKRHGALPPKAARRPIIPHPTDPSLALVELTMGYYATISIVDAVEVGRTNWSVNKHTGKPNLIYAKGWRWINGVRRRISLHRFIGTMMGLSLENEVDHENGNGLDCRRSNLRDATQEQNQQNRRLQKNNTSGVKGVTWNGRLGKWIGQIVRDHKSFHVGVFENIEEAEAATIAKRVELHGAFANHGLN